MIEAVLIAKTCLIVFGMSFVAALTDGPFGLCAKVRAMIRRMSNAEWVQDGVSCPICLSCWFGLITASLLASTVQEGVVLWLSAVGFTCVVTSLSPD